MELDRLCDEIGLQSEVRDDVMRYAGIIGREEAVKAVGTEGSMAAGNKSAGSRSVGSMSVDGQTEDIMTDVEIACYHERLRDIDKREDVLKEFKERLGSDDDGMKMLTCHLRMALLENEIYKEKGIDHSIFISTMKCFTRFISETKVMTGYLRFDRGWWTIRQITGRLYRIGELEYESARIKGQDVISMHIPTDAEFTEDKIMRSHDRAISFFSRYFPDQSGLDMICFSWLLSPNIRDMLKPDSNILKFQGHFDITDFRPDENGYRIWVFHTYGTDPVLFPEKTSLQRKMKSYVLGGGKIGEGFGIWRR